MKILKNILIAFLIPFLNSGLIADDAKLKVVTTLSVYADIAQFIGGDKVEVNYIVEGDQDAHYVRPLPSFAVMLKNADIFISTGLDLELWEPALLNMAGNADIRSGQKGYIAVSTGIDLLEKPAALTRSEGDMHLYGNPHIQTSPLNVVRIAQNITTGLSNYKPEWKAIFLENYKKFKFEVEKRLFGEELLQTMGSDILTRLAESGELISFLENKEFRGKKMITLLGGWFKESLAFRGKKIVAYHKSWVYFTHLFGLDVIGFVEPKPGIPPSPKHVQELIDNMKRDNVCVILAENYFSESRVREVAEKVDAQYLLVPLSVNGGPGSENYFSLVDLWINGLKKLYQQS